MFNMDTETQVSGGQVTGPIPLSQTPGLYMNSFRMGASTADIFIVLQHNGADVAVLNISYTLAKTLGEALGKLIEQLENKSGQKIMTAHTIADAMKRTPSQPLS